MKNKAAIITTTITEIGAGGDGIGLYNNKPVFIPKTTSGDVITARVEETKDDYKGQILKIETPSPHRVHPPCPYFDRCGGCALQHISISDYQRWKTNKVKTILERNGLRPEIWEEPVFIPPYTRRRTTIAVLKTKDALHLGYHAPRSHNIISIKKCLILEPILDQKIQSMRPYLLKLAPSGKAVDITLQNAGGLDVMLTGEWGNFNLTQQETLAAMMETLDIARISRRENEFGESEILLTRKSIIKKFGALHVPLTPTTFLQASDEGENTLIEAVLNYTAGAQKIADLFCGSGTFTGHLLATGAHAHAVDSDTNAIAALKHPKLTTQKRNLFKEPLSLKELQKFDCVVFDPPRAGAKEQTTILAESNIQRLIAVSCNPATFARDAKILKEGGYKLQSLKIVDQFVYSTHIELVGVFMRNLA